MRNHIPLKWTAAFVTVLVLGVIFLLLGSQSAPDPSKKTGELAVGLRPLAVQWSGLEQASRELEKAEPPGDRETISLFPFAGNGFLLQTGCGNGGRLWGRDHGS